MISGTVNAQLEATVRLLIRGPERELEVEVIVDTGFSGSLVLSPEMVSMLGLRFHGEGSAVLADGSAKTFDVYEALTFWNGRFVRLFVGSLQSHPLLGMSLLHGSELAMQVTQGGAVSIRELYRS